MSDFTTGDDDLPETLFEREERRHRMVRAENARRDRVMRARRNRAAKRPEPKAGDKLFVAAGLGLKSRGRAGIRFPGGFGVASAEVDVVDATDEELAGIRALKPGSLIVNLDGAEQILEDGALVVHSQPHQAAAPTEASAERDRLDAENKALREELQRLRNARRDAADSPTAAPTRLRAGQAAKSSASDGSVGAAALGESGEFGGGTKP
jgi:hypothetical protein